MQIAQVIIQRNTWKHYRFVEKKNFLHHETLKPFRFKMEGGLYHNFFLFQSIRTWTCQPSSAKATLRLGPARHPHPPAFLRSRSGFENWKLVNQKHFSNNKQNENLSLYVYICSLPQIFNADTVV